MAKKKKRISKMPAKKAKANKNVSINPEKKIYLAFTVLGDRSKHELVSSLVSLLHQRGHRVLTTHLLSKNVLDEEALNSAEFVFNRDKKWLDECDALVAEVSGASMGVGFEIGYLLAKDKKVYVLYDKSLEQKVSKMIRGNTMKNCVMFPYSDIKDVYKFVEEYF